MCCLRLQVLVAGVLTETEEWKLGDLTDVRHAAFCPHVCQWNRRCHGDPSPSAGNYTAKPPACQ